MIRQYKQNAILVSCVLVFSAGVYGKNKHPKPQTPQDEIQVVAHVSVPGDAVVRFLATQHYRRNYLYAEHQSGKTVTLIDITDLDSPSVLAEMSYPASPSGDLVAVAGNAALVTTANTQPEAAPVPQTFRILSFADPLHPAVQHEFKGVTAMARDDKRGLIFLANTEGVWVLRQRLAVDPQEEQEWEHTVLGAH
ncbi:MAG TPA: hypothetical protein VHZ07_05250 [Bryobacteraceae bacterium]|nr:hypothetical protein [Bryobacteraceae bacterium]